MVLRGRAFRCMIGVFFAFNVPFRSKWVSRTWKGEDAAITFNVWFIPPLVVIISAA